MLTAIVVASFIVKDSQFIFLPLLKIKYAQLVNFKDSEFVNIFF